MSLDELIRQMQEKGLLPVYPVKLSGRAQPTFELLKIMATTEPIEIDKYAMRLRLLIGRS